MPILTRYLTPEDYGIFSAFAFIAMIVSNTLRLEQNVYVKKVAVSVPEELSDTLTSSFSFSLILHATVITLLLIVNLIYPLEYLSMGVTWLSATIILSFFRCQVLNLHHLWQINNQATKYGIWTLTTVVVNYAIVFFLLFSYSQSWVSRGIAEVASACFSFIVATYILISTYKVRFKIDVSRFKEILAFAFPLLPTTLITSWFLFSDRFFISTFDTLESLGFYSVALQLAMSISIVNRSYIPVWEARIFRLLKVMSNETVREVKYKFLSLSFFCLMLAITTPFILDVLFPLFVSKGFEASKIYLLPCCAAISSLGLFLATKSPLIYLGKNFWLSRLYLVLVILNGVLMWSLISSFGVIGVPWALTTTFLIGSALQYFHLIKSLNYKLGV